MTVPAAPLHDGADVFGEGHRPGRSGVRSVLGPGGPGHADDQGDDGQSSNRPPWVSRTLSEHHVTSPFVVGWRRVRMRQDASGDAKRAGLDGPCGRRRSARVTPSRARQTTRMLAVSSRRCRMSTRLRARTVGSYSCASSRYSPPGSANATSEPGWRSGPPPIGKMTYCFPPCT